MGAVPSTLHQRLKFRMGNNIVTIQGDRTEDTVGSIESAAVEFQSFHFEAVNFIPGGERVFPPVQCDMARLAETMTRMGLQEGVGIGKYGQGIQVPLELPNYNDGRGLGCEEPPAGPSRRRNARMRTGPPLSFPPLASHFRTPSNPQASSPPISSQQQRQPNQAARPHDQLRWARGGISTPQASTGRGRGRGRGRG